MRVAVVGGGPTGLVTLKYLITAHEYFPGLEPIEAKLFEAEDDIGGTFRYRTYEDGELVSSKYLTCFSDFRPEPDEPQFMSVARYLEYLEQYCENFNLSEHIHLSTPVTSIRRRAKGHTVRYRRPDGTEQEWACDAVAICSGLHVTPEVPSIPGVEHVPVVMHSSEFRSRKQLGEDKTVVILGCGETAMDISYLAVTAPTKRVVICQRGGWVNAPKLLPESDFLPMLSSKSPVRDPYRNSPGIPIDCAHSGLFDTAYVHPIVRDSMIPWNFHHYLFTGIVPWLMTGTWAVWDQWVGKPRDPQYHTSKVLFNKSNYAMPYINVPFKTVGKGSLVEVIRSKILRTPSPNLHGRRIDLTSWPTHIDDTGRMHSTNNGSTEYLHLKDDVIRPDILILATGYRQTFPFFADQDVIAAAAETRALKDGKPPMPEERPYGRPERAKVRHIWVRGDPTVSFMGFVRPQIGAIPPIAEMQAMLWILTMVQHLDPSVPIPGLVRKGLPDLRVTEQWHYMLRREPGNRVGYGVDHDSYVYQLACDMDCAPSFLELLGISWRRGWEKGWNIIPTWAFVSQVNTKFRLRGPWKWDGAADVLHGELWTLVERNGGFLGLALQTALPFAVFGYLNFVCWVWASVLGLFGIRTSGPYTPVDTEKAPHWTL